MILLCLKILYNIVLISALVYLKWKCDVLDSKLKKSETDINTLHKNQKLIDSTLREFNKSIKSHDKSLKREVRIARNQEAGTEEG